MSLSPPVSRFWTPAQHSPWRLLLAAAATVAAVAHIPVTGEHLSEAPYMGVLFILLTIACLALAAAAVAHDSAAVYLGATAVCGLAVLGYAATRIVAFPMLADDVGNWLEPLGIVSVISELTVVASAQLALRSNSSRPSR
jgi:hypothetical protein